MAGRHHALAQAHRGLILAPTWLRWVGFFHDPFTPCMYTASVMQLRTLVACVLTGATLVSLAAYIGNGVIAGLDLATREQCQTKAWPKHQAKAHEAFCATYLTER